MNYFTRFQFPILFMLCVLSSCVKDEVSTEVAVYTEEVVFSSGEQAIMTGRVLAEGVVRIQDHGFHIDTDENFSNPIVISLGEISLPGRFVGQTDQLNIKVNYFCRSFIVSDGMTILGNVLSFNTLAPKAIDFEPKEANPNNKLTIEGINLTADTKVLWGDQLITPNSISAETFVEINIPQIDNSSSVIIQIIAQGDTSAIDIPFEYIVGEWTDDGLLDDPLKNTRHVFFEEGDDFVYGLGLINGNITNTVQVLNKDNFQRNTIFFPGTPVEGAFFNETYFGGGSTTKVLNDEMSFTASTEFWHYDDQSFTQLADAPKALYQAVALVAGDKIYLYGGEDSIRTDNYNIYIYDISNDSWSGGTNSPISPSLRFPNFHLDGYNYFVTTEGITFRHDLLNNTWDQVASFPTEPKEDGLSLPLNGVVYVGMQESSRRFYVYRPATDTWRTKTSLPNNNPFTTMGGWTHNDELHVVRISQTNFVQRILWRLAPEAF